MAIVQIYAVTSDHKEEEIEEFYQDLEKSINKTPKKDVTLEIPMTESGNLRILTEKFHDHRW